jgi:type IX secretion system PorP/SprF family membrane protein
MKTSILSLCLFIIAGSVHAQSYHHSQFFSTPLLTNPAHTGFTDGPYRLASNFRSQGTQSAVPYFTGYLSADVSLLRNRLTPGHKAGVGLYVMNDRSLSGALQTNSIGFSTAYNVGLDTYGERSFGVGVQGTYHQRRLDYSKLTFENQYSLGGYDLTLPVGEPLNFNSKHFFDLNAGVLYNATIADKSFFAGLSVYNILNHNEEIIGEPYNIPTHITLQGGTQFLLSNDTKLHGSFTTMLQGGAYETTLGAAYSVQPAAGQTDELIGGLWYRYKDALIPYIGYQRQGLGVGLSYDYSVSAVKTGAQVRNSFELTLMYKPPDVRELKTLIPWY